jgi:4-hydroxy-tetrahydrodipicolinate reductase
MIKVGISGCLGRMGKRITRLVLESKEFKLKAALEKKGHPQLNRDIGEILAQAPIGVKTSCALEDVIENIDCLIEFTNPGATLEHLIVAKEKRKPMVIGTTGFSSEEYRNINEVALDIPLVLSSNMSLGVNLLFRLVQLTAKVFREGCDIEIVESHHRYKKDAPSGTARRLAELITEARGVDLARVYGRRGEGERKEDEIGIHVLRAGDIIGEHTVIFCLEGERIELTHKAHSRDIFAKGALLAAKYIVGKEPGLYDMNKVLGLDLG